MTGAFQRHIRGVGSNAYAGRNKFDTSEKHPSHDMTPECQSKNSRNRTFFLAGRRDGLAASPTS